MGIEAAAGLLAGLGGVAGTHYMADKLVSTGESVAEQAGQLAGQLQNDTQFRGYGVTSALGNIGVAPDGSTSFSAGLDSSLTDASNNMLLGAQSGFQNAVTMAPNAATNELTQDALGYMNMSGAGLSAQQQQALAASQAAMQNAQMPTAQREQEVFNRAMAMQNPALERAQAQQQAREFAMGRSGVRGSQFGGTAEDAAMARARAEAANSASFMAMQQAQQEMMNQGALASQFGQQGLGASQQAGNVGNMIGNLGVQNANLGQQGVGLLAQVAGEQGRLGLQANQMQYLPIQTQIAMLNAATPQAGMSQSGQFTGAGYAAQLGLGGLQAQINAEKAASEMYGNMFDSILDNTSSIGGMIGNLF